MFQQKNRLRTLMALLAALTLLASAVPVSVFAEGTEVTSAETLETVSSYPYTTKTKVKVNLRSGRSTRSGLVKKVPAGATITVKAVKGSWAEVEYGKYSGYMKTDYIVLKEVKKTTPVKETPTPTPVPTLSPEEDAGGYKVLQKGDEGTAVRAMQEALTELGYLKDSADGKFGAGTEKAVIAFQEKNSYPATGIMDANIQAFLYTGTVKNAAGEKVSVKTLSPVEGVSMKKGNRGSEVRALQVRLSELGFLKSENITGTYDTNTIGAVRSFQKKNGMTADGTASAEVQKRIYAEDAVPANATPTPKPSATPTPTPTPVPVPEESIKNGDKGDDVKNIQRRLKELGYYKSAVDGKFGRTTTSALKAFQEAHGLEADGVAGKATYAILFSENALKAGTTPTPAPTATPKPEAEDKNSAAVSWPTLRKNDSGENVAQLQEALAELGYLSGKIDGNYGTNTVEAVKAFQKANGLTADGTAGENTQKMLFGGNAKKATAKATATPKPAATAAPKTTEAPATALKEGSKGSDVKALQQKLIQLGYLSGKADGSYGVQTAEAVKAYQKANKLTADGVAGVKTLNSLNSASDSSKNSSGGNSNAQNTENASTSAPSASKVQYANWYDKVKAVARQYPYATVYDFATGISWQIHIISLGAHADYEPVTANDTARMVKAFGGNTWNPRAVWVTFSDGSVYIGSTHSMPHEVYHIRDNNFNGHSCLHFPRTQEQVKAIGPYATKHQETIDAGWAATQKKK